MSSKKKSETETMGDPRAQRIAKVSEAIDDGTLLDLCDEADRAADKLCMLGMMATEAADNEALGLCMQAWSGLAYMLEECEDSIRKLTHAL